MTAMQHEVTADFDDWLNGLSGTAATNGSSTHESAQREGELMRRWLRGYSTRTAVTRIDDAPDATNLPTSGDDRMEANWQIIRDRIREREAERARQVAAREATEELANDRGRNRSQEPTRVFSAVIAGRRTLGLILGALVFAGVGYWSTQRQHALEANTSPSGAHGETIYRGDDGVTRIESTNPSATASEIIDAIKQGKKKYRRVDLQDATGATTGAIEIQVRIERATDEGLSKTLQERGINIPENGNVDIVVVPKGSPSTQ